MDNHLKKARLLKGLTQASVAAAIGRDQGTVSKYETGSSRVAPDVAPKLATVLGIGVIEVLYGPGGVTTQPPAKAA